MRKLALCIASTLTISMAYADEPWLADFRRTDLNDSGGLSTTELSKVTFSQLQTLKNNFKAVDADRDGHVTPEEYRAYLGKAQDDFAARFKKADLNDSGGLSKVELGKVSGASFDRLKAGFDKADTDKDGQLSMEESNTFLSAAPVTGKAVTASRNDQCSPDCGVVAEVDRYKIEGEGSLLGTIAGGVAGGLLGNQVGGGTGKTVATVGGAAGGAYAGHTIEKKLKTKKMVKVTVRMDNGQTRDFDFEADKSPFAKGSRVQIVDGQVTQYTGK